jgi:hypothetical protein
VVDSLAPSRAVSHNSEIRVRDGIHSKLAGLSAVLLWCCAISYLAAESATDASSPFHATVRTFEVELPPGDINVGGTTWNPCGHIEIVGPDGATNRVRWVAESRGEAFDLNPITAFSGSMVPRNLQWDSTDPYLYYEFWGGAAASGVWRVHATNSIPVYVGPTREAYRLQSQSYGPDWVVCNQVRDGKWLRLAYTPEDIAQPRHAFSTNIVDTPTSPTSATRQQDAKAMHISYRDENYSVPEGEIWKLSWTSPQRGRNFPSYDVRVYGLCYTSKDKGTPIHAFSSNPLEDGLVDIWAGDVPAEIWIPSGIAFCIHNDGIRVRVE